MFRDATPRRELVAAARWPPRIDGARLEARAADGWTTPTELADTLVREHDVPFRTAHAITGRLIAARRDPERPLVALAEASAEPAGHAPHALEPALAEILSPRHFVAVRRTHGGPAPEEARARVGSQARPRGRIRVARRRRQATPRRSGGPNGARL